MQLVCVVTVDNTTVSVMGLRSQAEILKAPRFSGCNSPAVTSFKSSLACLCAGSGCDF
jgi:hypothetical protein